MAAIRRYLIEKLMLVYTKDLTGIRRYSFRKILLGYTKEIAVIRRYLTLQRGVSGTDRIQ